MISRLFSFFFSNKESPSSVESKSPNDSASKEKRIYPAISYLRSLQQTNPSSKLKAFLADFNEPRPIDAKTFAEGVKKFIQLANLNPLDEKSEHGRKAFYGNSYLGLAYANDLVKLWNRSCADNETIQASRVCNLAPFMWDSVCPNGVSTLIYKGRQPAQALDELVKGPTAIDCNVFAQLSLWFGIRYLLGNKQFNQYFGRAPFFVTRVVYQEIEDSDQPDFGNPLYSFLAAKGQAVMPAVTVKYVANTPLYSLKKPGGTHSGENCIVIDDQYSIFGPCLPDTQGLTEAAVLKLLHQAFNEERAQYVVDRLAVYESQREKLDRRFNVTYGDLILAAEALKDKKLTAEEFVAEAEQDPSLELTFDFHKFLTWLQRMKSNEIKFKYVQRSIDNEEYYYGYQPDGEYRYPPFIPYHSDQYINLQCEYDKRFGLVLRR